MSDDLSEIKRVLRSVWWTQRRLDADLERLAMLRAKAEGVRGMEYDRQTVHGGAEHRALEDAACAIADCEAKIAGDIKRLTDALSFVMGIIDAVRDQRYSMVLTRYYRDGWTLEKIAVEFSYSWRHVKRLHKKALLAADAVYQAQKQKDVTECPHAPVI